MNFLEKVTAILNDLYYIKGLEELISIKITGTVPIRIHGNLGREDRLKILRLQTLVQQEQNSLSDIKIPCIRDDTNKRVQMIRQMMVEIVRRAIPTECDRFDAIYYISCESDEFKLYCYKLAANQNQPAR